MGPSYVVAQGLNDAVLRMALVFKAVHTRGWGSHEPSGYLAPIKPVYFIKCFKYLSKLVHFFCLCLRLANMEYLEQIITCALNFLGWSSMTLRWINEILGLNCLRPWSQHDQKWAEMYFVVKFGVNNTSQESINLKITDQGHTKIRHDEKVVLVLGMNFCQSKYVCEDCLAFLKCRSCSPS